MIPYDRIKFSLDTLTNRQTNRSSEACPPTPATWAETKNKGISSPMRRPGQTLATGSPGKA